MGCINIHEAKAKLSELIQRALDGEDVVIGRRNRPLVRLVLVDGVRERRQVGWAAGQVHLAPDFDETPEDFADYL